ncbi:DUF523 domain-containing protein [Mitsuaria sp. WAJ17]|uniref:DUF523 domain-containing protein n=1 Tax=Mitsuaria sp. WAJ17 TaxID=2761452 RepID=UPI001601515B|nr:DUF523 domain-containing protein [Mitsuaria sp. WAJ17]MBB2487962.1 DUF523 domain-containing protein [Mitsuaria sp. WAJ17]
MADSTGRPQILVSACLLGAPVRYDGRTQDLRSPLLEEWQAAGLVLPLCPELAGGLPVPRPPAEIEAGAQGWQVWLGEARIRDAEGGDPTDAFKAGAVAALALVQRHGLRIAVLKEGSPSCGSERIASGHFDGVKRAGAGLTAALLRQHGVQVFSEHTLEAAETALRRLARG